MVIQFWEQADKTVLIKHLKLDNCEDSSTLKLSKVCELSSRGERKGKKEREKEILQLLYRYSSDILINKTRYQQLGHASQPSVFIREQNSREKYLKSREKAKQLV